MNKKWKVSADLLGGSKENILETLLKGRGIVTDQEKADFFQPKPAAELEPESIGLDKAELKKALKQLAEVREKNGKVVIYGDYDADGITSTAIMWEALTAAGFEVLPFIPDREAQGYGIKKTGIEAVVEKYGKPDLILTVDNGIVAFEGVEWANEQGVAVIVCDHHEPQYENEKAVYPEASAVVHSTQTAGAGVSYVFAKEIAEFFGIDFSLQDAYELAAIGCIADVVSLIGPSRSIAKYGLLSMETTNRPGLRALLAESKIAPGTQLGSYHVGFVLAPRLNAAGRIGDSMESLRLLCTRNSEAAMKLAVNLGYVNQERQDLTQSSLERALGEFSPDLKEKILISSSKEYNPGVIGLVAGKLVEKYYKPAIVIAVTGDEAKGSVRSVSGVNIIDILRVFRDEFVDLGGHPLAAGFTVKTENIEKLKQKLIEYTADNVDQKALLPELKVDLVVNLSDLTMDLVESLEEFAPFGMGNARPVFGSLGVEVVLAQAVGRTKSHLRLKLRDLESGVEVSGIYFSAGEWAQMGLVGSVLDAAYTLKKNVWNGRVSLQMQIVDLKQNSSTA
jgi:single-stranded-DNA-specific exonuclease